MSKLKLGLIFGGVSTENAVSVVSGTAIIENLDKEKYDIYPIYISKTGEWQEYTKPINEIKTLKVTDTISQVQTIENIVEYLKKLDVIFPVLHGLYGEDGTIQGLFELLNKKYVGCKVLASSLCMDKVYTKIVLEKAKIEQADYIYIKKNKEKYIYVNSEFEEENWTKEEICKLSETKLSFPVFVKPSNSGSSVGISKAHNLLELEKALEEAGKYDNKILVEKNIEGREIECAVFGNEDIKVSGVGEILPAEEFYTFDAKYVDTESRIVIPADLPIEIVKKIKNIAIKAYKAVDAKGLSRVDFFIEKDTNRVILNEINTMPGFTTISMYPKLWEQEGINYSELLDKLVELALE